MGSTQISAEAGVPVGHGRLTSALLLACAGCAGGAVLLGFTVAVGIGSPLVDPVLFVCPLAVAGFGSLALALYGFAGHFDRRLARLLLAVGYLFALLGLAAVESPVAFTVARLASAVGTVALVYLCLAYPRGKLGNRVDSRFVGVAAAGSAVLLAANVLLSELPPMAGPFVRCSGSACPANPLNVVDIASGPSRALAAAFGLWTAAMMAGTVILVARHRRDATQLQRRTRLPMFTWAAIAAASYGWYVADHSLDPDTRLIVPTGVIVAAIVGLLPVALVLGTARGRAFTGAALERMMRGLGERPGPAELQSVLARAFEDPPLQLLVWRPSIQSYVDTRGRPVRVEQDGPARHATAVRRNGHTLALLVHDSALADDPALLESARAAVLLALENSALEEELHTTTSELAASRGRVVAAAAEERRRIEHDLHDGAQQELIAVRIRLALLEDLAVDDPQVAAGLADAGRNIEASLQRIRELVAGSYPPTLRTGGLAPALGSLIRELHIEADLDPGVVKRFSPKVETAAYFCCLEALQNVTKHAGVGARARVLLSSDADTLSFEVADDGLGFNQALVGDSHGITGMRDRMRAAGGEVAVTSSPGGGTKVTGWLRS